MGDVSGPQRLLEGPPLWESHSAVFMQKNVLVGPLRTEIPREVLPSTAGSKPPAMPVRTFKRGEVQRHTARWSPAPPSRSV